MKKLLTIPLLLITIFTDITYKPIYVVSNNVQDIHLSDDVLNDNKHKDFNEILGVALDITTDDLSFSLGTPGNMNTSKLVITRKAHCVGYVTYYNSVLGKLLKNNKINGVKITHVRAKLIMCGVNLTSIIDDPNFKDHDVSIIHYNGMKYVVDPSLSDILLTDIIKKM